MPSVYKVSYYNPAGLRLIESLPFSSFEFIRKENEYGIFTVRIPPNYPVDFFKEDGRLELWRSINSGTFTLQGQTPFLIRRPHYYRSNGEDIIELQGYDLIEILNRRIVAYESGTTYTEKLGIADDVIKDLVRENFGASAIDTARNLSAYISVQANTSLGAIVGDSISNKKIYDAAKNFASASASAGVRVLFDFVKLSDNSYEFRTWKDHRGQDHTQPGAGQVVVSVERGNLKDPDIILDYTDETNYVYAAGKGDEATRITTEVSDSVRIGKSPFARSEYFENASNVTDLTTLGKVANAALANGRPRIQFNGQVLETPSTMYGIHYGYGDLIKAEYRGYSFNCRVDTVRISFDRQNGEQFEIRLKGESYA